MSASEGATGDVVRRWVRRGQTRVDPHDDGKRLDRFLAGRFTYRSRTQWGELIRAGRITVNQARVRPSRGLRQGDVVSYVPTPRAEPPIDPRFRTLYRDDCLVAIAKSGNLPIHPSGRYFRHTLLHLLADAHPEWGTLHVIHRLDRETSGVVVFARSSEATERVAVQFRERRVEKRYLALVEGSPPEDRFVIEKRLGPATNSLIRKAVGVRDDGLPAATEIRVLHRGAGWAWVEARPRTGRQHQIRVHLKSAGLPIVGDKVYGRSERFFLKFISDEPLTPEEETILGMSRQALHAYSLAIAHPTSGEPLVLTAPLPEDLAAALTRRGLDPTPWQAEHRP